MSFRKLGVLFDRQPKMVHCFFSLAFFQINNSQIVVRLSIIRIHFDHFAIVFFRLRCFVLSDIQISKKRAGLLILRVISNDGFELGNRCLGSAFFD